MAMGSIAEVGCQFLHEFYDARLAWLQERAQNILRKNLISTIRRDLALHFTKSTHQKFEKIGMAGPHEYLVVDWAIREGSRIKLEDAHRDSILEKVRGKNTKKSEKRADNHDLLTALKQIWARQSKRFEWDEASELSSKAIPASMSLDFIRQSNLDFGSLWSYAETGYFMTLAH
jgi:hypothetical protein